MRAASVDEESMSVSDVDLKALEDAKVLEDGKVDSGEVESFEVDEEVEAVGSGERRQRRQFWVSRICERLCSRVNAEAKGIERVEEVEKVDGDVGKAAMMWFAANMVISAYAVGALGPAVYGLNFGASVLTVVFFNLLGLSTVAFFSMFGAEFGLRQMVLTRFLCGSVTARLFAALNAIACVGWGSLNTLVSAQLLNEVNAPHELPLWAGCLVIIVGTVSVSFFGLKVIHTYEKYSWIPNFGVFLVIIARLKTSGQFSNGPWGGGANTAAGVLSFGGAIYGYSAGWTTYAADYTVYMPRSTSKVKIFLYFFLALAFPLIFTMTLGAAAGMGAVNNAEWRELYEKNNVGGLTYAILVPNSLHGFGQFCCVVLAMSTVGNNVPNMYTIALSVQALWEPLAKVPRMVWTLVGSLCVLAISIAAAYKLEAFIENFMNSIGYYLGIYIGISLSEHFIWRGGFKGYRPEDYDRFDLLPVGIAGCCAFIAGAFGVALGMSQTYWTGEIGRLIGNMGGGDIGFELGMGWAFVVYNVVRPFELKYMGR